MAEEKPGPSPSPSEDDSSFYLEALSITAPKNVEEEDTTEDGEHQHHEF